MPRASSPRATRVSQIRAELLKTARTRSKMTYGSLMRRFHLSRGRKLSQTIGEVDRAEYAEGAPGFAAIIVRKDTGFPGGGYFCDDTLPPDLVRSRAGANNPRLTQREKDHIRRKQAEIWSYYSKPSRR